MKKSSRSKDYKNKYEESKVPKGTRKRRKSESSESESEQKKSYHDKLKHNDAVKTEKEADNVRSTRHSRRLIGSSDDNTKEDKSISLTLKIEKSGSRDRSPKKKDSSESSKHKAKEANLWKVKSSNGKGAGEIQKLKICRQRTPEPVAMELTKIEAENEESVVKVSNDVDNASNDLESAGNNSENVSNVSENISNDVEKVSNDEERISNDSVEIINDDCDRKQSSLTSQCDGEDGVKEFDSNKENVPEVGPSAKQDSHPSSTNTCNIPYEDPSNNVDIVKPEVVMENADKSSYDDTKSIVQDISQVNNCSNIDENPEEVRENDQENVKEINLPSEDTVNHISPSSDNSDKNDNADDKPENPSSGDDSNVSQIIADTDVNTEQLVCETDNQENTEETARLDDVNEHSNVVVEPEPLPEQKPVQEVMNLHDEEYDYDENDDTEEEGEIPESDAMSPASQVYKKLPKEERVRNWGTCDVFVFNKTSLSSTEEVLKSYNVEKICLVQKDLMGTDSEDTDDLIFVKEIREENVIHEVESETSKYQTDDSHIVGTARRSGNATDEEEQTAKCDHDSSVIERSSKEIQKKASSSHSTNNDAAEDIKITFNNEKANQECDRNNIHNHRSKENKKSTRSPVRRNRDDKHSSRSQKNVEQDILCITNLVRPFTLTQLKELLQRTGKIVRDGFWIDSIKSKCYVQYETVDQAIETRHALHGIRWPVSNPKALNVRYATQDDMLKAQTQTDVTEIPRKTEPLVIHDHERRIEWRTRKLNENSEDLPLKPRIGVREWDIGKPKNPEEMPLSDVEKNPLDDERDRQKRVNRSRKSRTPPNDEQPVKKTKKTEEREAKSLDELFRRTKTTPSVYWLPLTDEQISEKETLRRKQLELIKQRTTASKPAEKESHSKGDHKYHNNSKRR